MEYIDTLVTGMDTYYPPDTPRDMAMTTRYASDDGRVYMYIGDISEGKILHIIGNGYTVQDKDVISYGLEATIYVEPDGGVDIIRGPRLVASDGSWPVLVLYVQDEVLILASDPRWVLTITMV